MEFVLNEEEYTALKNKAEATDKMREGAVSIYTTCYFMTEEYEVGVYSGNDALSILHKQIQERDARIKQLFKENSDLRYANQKKRWYHF